MHDHKTHKPIGAFCIKDTKPRKLGLEEMNTLLEYAHKAEIELNRGVSPIEGDDKESMTKNAKPE